MAKKDNAVGKRLKISKAQQTMLGAVAGAALILGVCLVFSVYFLKYIKFNGTVITEKDSAIKGYSSAIKNIGVCKAPSAGNGVYNESELKSCDPNDIDLKYLSGTLRYNVIMNLSQDEALESVGRRGLSICYDTSTNKKRSFEWMLEKYNNATNDKDKETYLEMIGMCSSLRVIPDALPSTANPLALGASLNKIFQLSEYEPEGITPGVESESSLPGLNSILVNLEIDASTDTTMKVLNNLEKSIREINVKTARIEMNGQLLKVEATAEAFYTPQASLNELLEEVHGDGTVLKDTDIIDEEEVVE